MIWLYLAFRFKLMYFKFRFKIRVSFNTKFPAERIALGMDYLEEATKTFFFVIIGGVDVEESIIGPSVDCRV
jgi:hypothetical protein